MKCQRGAVAVIYPFVSNHIEFIAVCWNRFEFLLCPHPVFRTLALSNMLKCCSNIQTTHTEKGREIVGEKENNTYQFRIYVHIMTIKILKWIEERKKIKNQQHFPISFTTHTLNYISLLCGTPLSYVNLSMSETHIFHYHMFKPYYLCFHFVCPLFLW